MYNLPNILTLSRIVVIPVIFLSIYIDSPLWKLLTAILYAVAAITDYFDGYLARTRNQISVLGRLLDPIADKLLVVAALLIVVGTDMVHKIHFIPIVMILCREILVSGLREFLSKVKIEMPVTNLAKWKTTVQMVAIGLILFGAVPPFTNLHYLGVVLLWVAGILTFTTGYEYLKQSLDYVKSEHNKSKKLKLAVASEEVVKKTPVKRTPVKKAAVKKAPVKKVVVKKSPAKKSDKKTK